MTSAQGRRIPHLVVINSGKAEAVTELRKIVGDIPLTVITEDAYKHLYGPGETLHLVDDIADTTALRDLALSLHAVNPIDFILSPSERSMLSGGFLRTYLGLPGHGSDLANAFSNKALMKRLLQLSGLPVAPFRAVAGIEQIIDAAQDIGFPVVIKPAFGTGSMNTYRVDSIDELAPLLRTAAAGLQAAHSLIMVEKYVVMQGEYICDSVVVDGQVEATVVSRYFDPLLGRTGVVSGAHTVPENDPDVATIRELHRRTVSALGLTGGVTHMELFKVAEGFIVGEIACRPGGVGVPPTALAAIGLDLWRAFYLDALGLNMRPVLDNVQAPDGIKVWMELPTSPGRIISITDKDDLLALPGVTAVNLMAKPGDVISSRLHSSSTSGLVYLALPDAQAHDVKAHLKAVEDRFHLEVVPA